MSAPLRSLKDIHTRSGSVGAGDAPYKVYMQLTALEISCHRHKVEQKTLQARLKGIHARLRLLESQKTALLRRLPPASGRLSKARTAAHAAADLAQTIGSFRVRY